MNTRHTKYFILASVLITIGGSYVYFSHTLKARAADASPIASSKTNASPLGLVNNSANGQANDAQINQDTAFLLSLASLTKIKVDTAIFSDPLFLALKDNEVKLQTTVVSGRNNPFAPINGNSFAPGTLSPVVTNQATRITTNGAVFNGTINTTLPISSTYFEYGLTEKLGKVTQRAEQSLVGTFTVSISDLTPKTIYFYRAVVKVLNDAPLYGEVSRFQTN